MQIRKVILLSCACCPVQISSSVDASHDPVLSSRGVGVASECEAWDFKGIVVRLVGL